MIYPDVKLAGDTVDTEGDTFDLHIILEFDKGEKWGNFEATRANR